MLIIQTGATQGPELFCNRHLYWGPAAIWRLGPQASCAPGRVGWRSGAAKGGSRPWPLAPIPPKNPHHPPASFLQPRGSKGQGRGGIRDCSSSTQPFCPSRHTDTHTRSHTDTQRHITGAQKHTHPATGAPLECVPCRRPPNLLPAEEGKKDTQGSPASKTENGPRNKSFLSEIFIHYL